MIAEVTRAHRDPLTGGGLLGRGRHGRPARLEQHPPVGGVTSGANRVRAARALAIPNVAADKPNIRRNAEHLRGMLARHGFAAEMLETTGNPLVYGALRRAGCDADASSSTATTTASRSTPKSWKQPDPFKPVLRRAAMEISRRRRIRESPSRHVRARLAHLRAVGVRRQGADRRAAGRGRRAEGAGPRAVVELRVDPRRRGRGQLAEPRARRSRATRTSCAPT